MSKIFATDRLWENVYEVMQMAGGIGFSQEYPYEQFLRDSRINTIFEGTNEILRIFIALSGMQERGEYLKKMGKALKDPVKSIGVISDYAVHYMKDRLTTERIWDVNSSLTDVKNKFEEWAKNLHITTERVLIKYGKKIIEKQLIQERLADAAIDLYGMISCISRVDTDIRKSGIDACEEKIVLCNTFCQQAWRRVRRNILMIDKNSDKKILNISEKVIEKGKYLF